MANGDYLDETHQRISEFATEFLDDDEERESFVDGLMERRGYKRSAHWEPPEPPADGGGKAPLLRATKGAKQGGQGQGAPRSYFKGGSASK
jgi:hypothetical protein